MCGSIKSIRDKYVDWIGNVDEEVGIKCIDWIVMFKRKGECVDWIGDV